MDENLRGLCDALREGVASCEDSLDSLARRVSRLEYRLDGMMRYFETKDGDVFPSDWGPPTLLTTQDELPYGAITAAEAAGMAAPPPEPPEPVREGA